MNQSLGIFDSGVGGLTVAAAIRDLLPNESFIYFGDTLHAPYGDKSRRTIIDYSRSIIDFLLDQHCKAIVIACNSASALAFPQLRKEYPELLIINVIDPVTDEVLRRGFRSVGVIATRATIRSKIYSRRLQQAEVPPQVFSKATPLLAPLIEEGFANSPVSRSVIEKYLADARFPNLEALILGCTHYPLIQKDLEAMLKTPLEIIDSPGLVARYLARQLELKQLEANSENVAFQRFYVSEKTPAFNTISQRFFGEKLALEERTLSL